MMTMRTNGTLVSCGDDAATGVAAVAEERGFATVEAASGEKDRACDGIADSSDGCRDAGRDGFPRCGRSESSRRERIPVVMMTGLDDLARSIGYETGVTISHQADHGWSSVSGGLHPARERLSPGRTRRRPRPPAGDPDRIFRSTRTEPC